MKNSEDDFDVLELEYGSNQDEVKQAYRDLVNIWHPDRFEHNPRLKERATIKLKEINVAYENIKNFKPLEQEAEDCSSASDEKQTKPQNDHVSPSQPLQSSKGKYAGIWIFIHACILIFYVMILIGAYASNDLIPFFILSVGFLYYCLRVKRKYFSGNLNTTDVDPIQAAELEENKKTKMIENLVILMSADGVVSGSEADLLSSVASQFWSKEINEVKAQIDLIIKNINEGGESISDIFDANAKFLSTALKRKEKLEFLAQCELMMKSDDKVSAEERLLYSKLKESLKARNVFVRGFGLLRENCSHCKSTKINFLEAREVDRWKGTKRVTETLASGKTKTKNIATTFVKIKRYYECDECQYQWTVTSKEEK